MKTGTLIMTFVLATLGAVPAWACIPEPPPHWPSLLGDDGPALFIGRVSAVERLPEPRRTASLEITQSTAMIERLEAVQGTPQPTYRLTAAESVRRLDGDTGMVCVDFQRVRVGDIVLGMEAADGTVRVFESQQIPSQFTSRIEAYR